MTLAISCSWSLCDAMRTNCNANSSSNSNGNWASIDVFLFVLIEIEIWNWDKHLVRFVLKEQLKNTEQKSYRYILFIIGHFDWRYSFAHLFCSFCCFIFFYYCFSARFRSHIYTTSWLVLVIWQPSPDWAGGLFVETTRQRFLGGRRRRHRVAIIRVTTMSRKNSVVYL